MKDPATWGRNDDGWVYRDAVLEDIRHDIVITLQYAPWLSPRRPEVEKNLLLAWESLK